jgi:hypothetical protein
MKLYFASIALISAAACSSDPLEPGAGNEPGVGTKTLVVDGSASASPTTANAQRSTDFSTEFSVRIQLNGADVTTGAVTVRSAGATTTLTYDGGGRWRGTAANYDEVYQLDIVSGADEVKGVIVDGPSIHVITAPTAGASLDSTIVNNITWDREDGADIATLDTDNIDRLTIPDTGTYMMGAGVLKAEKDKSKENRIEIRRTNHVSPAGAVAGSDFAVSIENRVDVLAQPNPAL